jgi:hypothetical protein
MYSTRFSRVLIAACLAAAASCSDSTTSTTTPGAPAQIGTTPSLVTLTGVIRTGGGLDQLRLELAGGGDVVLGGSAMVSLRSLENDEVEVRGTWAGILDANDVLVVSDFLVRQVGGVDVLDGILTTLYDDDSGMHAVGYAITLIDGSSVPLLDPPQELINHLGERLWVATSADGKPEAFGVIGPPTT